MVGVKGTSFGLIVKCVRCDADREMPATGRPRMPATTDDPADGTTITTDAPCECGATRVRVTLAI